MVFGFFYPIRSTAAYNGSNDALFEDGLNSEAAKYISSDLNLLDWNNEKIEFDFVVPELTVEETIEPTGEVYHQINLDGTGYLDRAGQPKVPFRTLRILLPSGTDVEGVEIMGGKQHTLQGSYKIEPAQAQVRIGLKGNSKITVDQSVYDSVDPYPAELYSVVGVYEFRGYRILVLNLYPVSYIPKTGKITYSEDMKVRVNLNDCLEANRLFRALETDEERVREKIDNPQLQETYTRGISSRKATYSPTALPPASYNYVIITSEALKNSAGAYTFQDIVASKATMGVAANITTTEYIYSNYAGADNQAKIRNFILDAYATWGIEYVLLGGDGDGANTGGETGTPIIPARGFYDDFSEIDTNIPSDLYYAALDGTWNNDGDSYWGEEGEDDLYAEVYVGRAPVDSEAELSNFVYKTLSHESSADPYLSEALMVGEDLGWTSWGWQYKDEIKNGCDLYGYTTTGIPGDIYNVETLYDNESYSWTKSELIAKMNGGVHVINHLGHAKVENVMKMYNPDVDSSLTNDQYFFAYSQGCYDGAFDNRGTGGTYGTQDCIVEHFVATPHGAFAFIGNSRYGWGDGDSTDGASQHYDREFFDAIYAEDITEIGRANQDSKEDSIGFITTSNPMRWCYYETNLFGDPMATILPKTPDHELKVSLQLPSRPKFGNSYIINATVKNIGANSEVNVELYFYVDGLEVNVSTFPNLAPSSAGTISFTWTPAEYKTFVFRAYSPPIPGEASTKNNDYNQSITIRDVKNYEMTPEYTYTWVDAITGGTQLSLSDDGYSAQSLPFSFSYYDTSYTKIYVSANGWLSFANTKPSTYLNQPYPLAGTTYAYAIAPFWDDLYPSSSSAYVKNGTGYWVMTWINVPHNSGSTVGTFEVVLYETGDIVFNYDYLDYTAGGHTCGLNYGLDTDYYNSYSGLSNATEDFSILFAIPTVPPWNPSISINGGAEHTDSTLVTLKLSVFGAQEMCFRNGTTGEWIAWESYSTTKQVYLGGSTNNTEYTIQVKFQNPYGESAIASDSVLYLIVPPFNPSISVNGGAEITDSTLVTLTLFAVRAQEMCFRNGTVGAWTAWEPYSTSNQVYLAGSVNNTEYMIQVKFQNPYGESAIASDSILYLVYIYYQIWHDDFESGLAKWETPTGLWHMTNTSSAWSNPCHSPTHSMWYGQESSGYYNTSAANSGNLSSTPIDLSSVEEAYLELYHWKQTEWYASYDHTYIYVTTDDNIWNLIYSNYTDVGPWEKLRFDISNYCGNSSFRIRFYFDTVDRLYNSYRGWLVDDVSIKSLLPSTPPWKPSISIDDGAEYTDSTLVTLSLSAVGAQEMCFRNGTTGEWTAWEPYSTSKQVYLASSINNTEYTIQVKCQNIYGESAFASDSILFLVYPPLNPSIRINGGAGSTDSTLVTLTLSAVKAQEMCFRNGTTGEWTAWEPYSTTKQVYLGGSTNNTEYTIQIKFQNIYGESAIASDSILYLIAGGDGDDSGDDDYKQLEIPGFDWIWLVVIVGIITSIIVPAVVIKRQKSRA